MYSPVSFLGLFANTPDSFNTPLSYKTNNHNIKHSSYENLIYPVVYNLSSCTSYYYTIICIQFLAF